MWSRLSCRRARPLPLPAVTAVVLATVHTIAGLFSPATRHQVSSRPLLGAPRRQLLFVAVGCRRSCCGVRTISGGHVRRSRAVRVGALAAAAFTAPDGPGGACGRGGGWKGLDACHEELLDGQCGDRHVVQKEKKRKHAHAHRRSPPSNFKGQNTHLAHRKAKFPPDHRWWCRRCRRPDHRGRRFMPSKSNVSLTPAAMKNVCKRQWRR